MGLTVLGRNNKQKEKLVSPGVCFTSFFATHFILLVQRLSRGHGIYPGVIKKKLYFFFNTPFVFLNVVSIFFFFFFFFQIED